MMFGTLVSHQSASHRQGMVLGLTMAEIMLLLVFCLLIAAGASLAVERAERNRVVRQLQEAQAVVAQDAPIADSLRRNGRLAALFDHAAAAASKGAADEFWRKLVENEEMVEALEVRGVSRTSLKDGVESFAKFQALRGAGLEPDRAAKAAALVSAIDRALPDDPVTRRTPEDIAALIARGLAAAEPAHTDDVHSSGHDWPPIINLSEAGGYFFATRSAELSADFENKLRTTVTDRLLGIAQAFPVDVIEVIGHTDERPVSGAASNLDRELASVMSGASAVGILQAGDNAGLGLARAVAVVKVLASDPRLRNFRILPLSAAQLIATDGRLTRWGEQGDVRERRRIEIRMRKAD